MIQREHLGSRLGFILLSAGCAIGVGNVWKFPWLAGQYGGRWWGSLFFLFMMFAAFSTIIAVFENILACVRELTGWGRIKACVICGIAILLLSVPCALGYNLWSNFVPFASGSAVLELEDFLVSNCCLPLGALCYVLFCVSKKGWGFENFLAEANAGKGLKLGKWIRPYVTYVLPICIKDRAKIPRNLLALRSKILKSADFFSIKEKTQPMLSHWRVF